MFFFNFQSQSEVNFLQILTTATEIFHMLGVLFADCELCQQISNTYDEINDKILQLSWYRFPIEVNRMLPIISMMTQQSVEFKCFGSTPCRRTTFTKVCPI